MPNHICTLTTTCYAHPVLHRLREVAEKLAELYDGIDLPDHAASTHHGNLLLSRILPEGKRIAATIAQTGQHTLQASLSSGSPDTNEMLRQVVSPLVTAYHKQHPKESESISTTYEVG